MVMRKAINRFIWRFQEATKKDNTFRINENDLDALKAIVKYYEETMNQRYTDSTLFAKMYVYHTMQELHNTRASLFEHEARKKLGGILKRPLSQLLEELTQTLNDSEAFMMIDKAKVPDGIIPDGMGHIHPSRIEDYVRFGIEQQKAEVIERWIEQRNQEHDNWLKLYEENPEACLGMVWDTKTVEECIIPEINLMIEKHG